MQAPNDADVKDVEPPLYDLVPTQFGKLPPAGLKLGDETETFPPEGVNVPEVELFVPMLPVDATENEFTKDLEIFIVDIVTFPAEAVEPL